MNFECGKLTFAGTGKVPRAYCFTDGPCSTQCSHVVKRAVAPKPATERRYA
jgi:hypothetical protein